jgi:asparagine synthetase B (glutamine-hydrolysing)
MLSGEGADDIFGGYSNLLEHEETFMKTKEAFLERYAYMRPSLVNLPEDIPFDKFKEWGMEQFILRIHTPGLISRARNACYAAGMDVRFPYLEGDLAQYMWSCRREFKKEKNTLKKLAEKYLPHEIIYRGKIGFPVPLDEWLGEKGIQQFLMLNVNIWRSTQ